MGGVIAGTLLGIMFWAAVFGALWLFLLAGLAFFLIH